MSEYLNFWFSILGVSQIVELFIKSKIEIRFVGGCVRDALLGEKNSDIDFVVNCKPNIVCKILLRNMEKNMEQLLQ